MKMLNFLNRVYRPSQPNTQSSYFRFSGGTPVNPESAMQVSAFYSGVMYISTQIAKLPWYIKNRKNEIVSNDPIANLIGRNPNKEMTSFTFRLTMVQNAIIYGNAYAEIERDLTGKPKGLWPIPSTDVEPFRDANGKLWYRVIGGDVRNRGDVYLEPRDIFHIKNFHTKDGLTGHGIVSYATQVLGIALGADKFASSLYANGGMPSGVLEIDGTLSEDAQKRLKESWSKSHGGSKVGGTAILEEGLTYKPITYQPDVMQFLESRQFNVLEMARFLRIPPTKLYDQKTSSYNNIEHANLEVAIDTLDAWARNFEAECDSKLLSENFGGKQSEMDLYAVFRGDMETRSKYFTAMVSVAALSSNEIRKFEGMAPYEGGDRYYVATNNYSPVDRVDEIVDAQVKPKESEKKEPEENSDLNNAVVNYLQRKAQ